MAQIPGIPDLEPVQMDPRTAGRGGQAIAHMGEDIGEMASLQGHIREAQKSVDQLAAHNMINAAAIKYQDQLEKTANSRDVPEVQKQAEEGLQSIVKQWSHSPAALEIQMAADALNPKIEHLATVRGVDLMGKEWKAQADLQLQTLLPELVTARRSGNAGMEQVINDHINHIYDDAVQKHLLTDGDKQMAMQKIQEGFRKDLNEAAVTSSDPSERKQAIAQLTKGSSGPLDLTGLTPGEVNALRMTAIEKDKRLTELAEATNLNGALNIKENAFKDPAFKNADGTPNHEARMNALDDGDWLTKHGFVDDKGQPDRVMANKLISDEERQRTFHNQERDDHDEKVLSEILPKIDAGKMKMPDIDDPRLGLSPRGLITAHGAYQQVVNRAHQAVVEARAEEHFNYSVQQQRRAEAKYNEETRSKSTANDLMAQMVDGHMTQQILQEKLGTGQINYQNYEQLTHAFTQMQAEPDTQSALAVMYSAIPPPPKTAGADSQAEYQNLRWGLYEQFQQGVAEKGLKGADKTKYAIELVKPFVEKDVATRLDAILASPGMPAPKEGPHNIFWDIWHAGETKPNQSGPAEVTAGRIRVRDKATGRTGTIPSSEYDDSKYEKVQ